MGERQVVLFYASADERDAIFGRQLRTLAANNPARLSLIEWDASRRGRPAAGDI